MSESPVLYKSFIQYMYALYVYDPGRGCQIILFVLVSRHATRLGVWPDLLPFVYVPVVRMRYHVKVYASDVIFRD